MENRQQRPGPGAAERIKGWLLKRAEDHKGNLRLLIIGAGIFFSGAGIIVWANHVLPSSLEQELIALAGSLMILGGGGTALVGYLGLSILRLFKFFNDDPPP